MHYFFFCSQCSETDFAPHFYNFAIFSLGHMDDFVLNIRSELGTSTNSEKNYVRVASHPRAADALD